MRHRPPVDDSSEESEYTGSSVDDGVGSDTDLTDVDEDSDGTADEAWLFPDEVLPPEHFLQQMETFDHQEYTEQDYKDKELNTTANKDLLAGCAIDSVCTVEGFCVGSISDVRGLR